MIKKEFGHANGINQRTVRDYCHYIDKYRGAANNICNSKKKTPGDIVGNIYNEPNTIINLS